MARFVEALAQVKLDGAKWAARTRQAREEYLAWSAPHRSVIVARYSDMHGPFTPSNFESYYVTQYDGDEFKGIAR